jgi:hypothetical protein
MRVNLTYNETSRSISSVIESPTSQNITISMGIQSFGLPISIYFETGPNTFSTIREFKYNPQAAASLQKYLTPYSNALNNDVYLAKVDWNISNNSAYNDSNWQEFPLPARGFTINAPTLQLQPYSEGTFRFSMLVSNLTAGYYVTFLGFAVAWKNSPGGDAALDLATYFPISVGSGQWNQDITGTCPTMSGY